MLRSTDTFSILPHPTLIAIDYGDAIHEGKMIPEFVKNETDYDIAFCKAWAIAQNAKERDFSKADKLLNLLDRIQAAALSHLPVNLKVERCIQRLNGRVTNQNYFGLLPNFNSDEKGVRDLMAKMFFAKDNTSHLIVKTGDPMYPSYRLSSNKLVILEKGVETNEREVLLEAQDKKEQYEEICDTLLPFYRRGLTDSGHDPLVLHINMSKRDREIKAKQIIGNYLNTIKSAANDKDKITTIAILIKDLTQLHLYYDGNGRSLYILANRLFQHHQLPLTYPQSMCVFEGNSIETMLKEVQEGQERFTSYFGSNTRLTNGLRDYKEKIEELEVLTTRFSNNDELKAIVKSRKLDILLRKSASSSDALSLQLLKFLIDNAATLNLDIRAKGRTSGNALDVAAKHGNQQAVVLLERVGLQLSQQT